MVVGVPGRGSGIGRRYEREPMRIAVARGPRREREHGHVETAVFMIAHRVPQRAVLGDVPRLPPGRNPVLECGDDSIGGGVAVPREVGRPRADVVFSLESAT